MTNPPPIDICDESANMNNWAEWGVLSPSRSPTHA